MASRELKELHPIFRMQVEKWLELCKSDGINVLIYMTYRSIEEQNELYKKGRMGVSGEDIVTNAKGGESSHNYRAGIDSVPLTADKKPWWDAPDGVWRTMAIHAESAGIDSYFDKFGKYLKWDKGHNEMFGWEILKDYLLKSYEILSKAEA